MLRILLFFAILIAAALGLGWLADRPGDVVLSWQGYRYETSLMTALAGIFVVGVAMILLWTLLRIVFKLPSIIALAGRARRRAKGFAAVSRGMVAVGAGDTRAAQRGAAEAQRLLGDEPMTLLLAAQAAQLSGDRSKAEAVFSQMLGMDEMRVLGLRGLFIEAHRKGDAAAARFYADEAYKLAPAVPWVGEAALGFRLRDGDWQGALGAIEQGVARRVIDKASGRRQRAVLLTASALSQQSHNPESAFSAASEAFKLEPGLVPAAVLVGRRLAETGQTGKASKLLETAWKRSPHPDIAQTYLDARLGNSALDRLARARALQKLTPAEPEAALTVARAALDAREFAAARDALAPCLAAGAPTARACLLMAELEEKSGGASGLVREWLARASRAPRDRAWVADGVVQAEWAPYSPVTGKIDAFVWQEPPQALIGGGLGGFDADAVLADADEPAQPLAAAPVPAPRGEPATESAKDLSKTDLPKADLPKTGLPTPANDRAAFPLPHAPDDPGPEELPAASKRRFKLFS